MLALNLLPPQEKQILSLEQTQRWILFYGSALCGILIIFLSLLGIIWLYVNVQLQSAVNDFQEAQMGLKGRDLQAQQNLTEEINQNLGDIDDVQKNHKFYSKFLISLATLTPPGVQLQNLSVNVKNEIVLGGHASQRDILLSFKDALEKSNLFEKIESPLSNITKQNDIDFYFKLNLKPEVLTVNF